MDDAEQVRTISIKKRKSPEKLQPRPRDMCAVGGAGPDRRIDEILQNLKAIRAAPPGAPAKMPDSVIKELAKTVKHILSIVEGRAAIEVIEEPLLVSYPKTGKKTLTAGITTINIRGRQVRLADGTVDDLYSPRSFQKCRSLLVYTDREVDVRVLNGGDVVLMSSFFTGSQQLLHLGEFDSVEIETTASTQIYIAMSEDPEGAPSTIQSTTVNGKTEVISSPTGAIRTTGSDTTAVGSFTEIVSYTPDDGVTFSLAKILVTWADGVEQAVRVKLDDEIVAMYYARDYIMDWFPSEMSLMGDGTKTVAIEAKAVAVVATMDGFIAGEET